MLFLADTPQKVDCIHRAILTFCVSLHFLRSVLVRISSISSSDSRKSHFFSSFLKKKKKTGRRATVLGNEVERLPTAHAASSKSKYTIHQPRFQANIPSNRWYIAILGDPVSRVGRKGGTKVFKYVWKSPWVPTLTELFPKIQADAGSLLGTKNALYYCAQSANSFSWVLFVSSYTTVVLSRSRLV